MGNGFVNSDELTAESIDHGRDAHATGEHRVKTATKHLASNALAIVGIFAALAGGCASHVYDNYAKGTVPDGLYKEAVVENQQRLAGEDKRIQPLYETPTKAVEIGWDEALLPFETLIDIMTRDTAGMAARKMVDPNSPDNRRVGISRMSDFSFARQSKDAWATFNISASNSNEDYTVRAAGLRALNRSRAPGYTPVFLKALGDDQVLVRLQGADGLSNIPDPAAVPALISRLGGDVSPDVRIACAEALRNFKNQDVIKALIDSLENRDFSVGWDFGVAWQARQSLAMLTGQDFRYDREAWLGYLGKMKF